MSIDAMKVAQAYANIANAAGSAQASALGAPQPARPDFSNLVKDAIGNVAQDIKSGETAGMNVAAGKSDLVEVVTAISAAEVSLEAAIAVRNKMIEAYQEIMRMPI